MWLLIMAAVVVVFAAGVVYLTSRFYKFKIVNKISHRKSVKIVISFIPIAIIFLIILLTMNMMNAIVVILHLMVAWLICDLANWLIKKIGHKQFKRYYAGAVAIVFTFVYLCVGYYLANNVWRTEYNIKTTKNVQNLKVVVFSDSHVNTTFNGHQWKQYIDRMNKENPDVVLIVGDFVDDDTTKDDMIASCKAMSSLKTKYGVYYVFGNHDKGYYGDEYRGYGGDDLIKNLKANNVRVLQDESVLVNNQFYIIGRQDRSETDRGKDRASMKKLTKNIDSSKFSIVMDHQPYDYDNEQSANVDMVISGHTHGGQFIPINHVGELTGENAKCYGYEKRGNTNFIVTSGISDWAFKFKTGCKSEYVVINVN